MKLKKVDGRNFNAGDAVQIKSEPDLPDLKFKIHKFNSRKKPSRNNICIFPMFSEFGCEMLGAVYCLPKLLRGKYIGKYVIVMGWKGRSYLYKHLADEFWEMEDDHQWLRDYCRAFHHQSKNLRRAEKQAAREGIVVDVSEISNVMVFPILTNCPGCNGDKIARLIDDQQCCLKCRHIFPSPGMFNTIRKSKKEAVWIPKPTKQISIKPNSVGITARRRKTYGRNLQPIFYERLIYLLEDMGYNPVWLGEKVTTLPCPFERIPDFTSESDLETTLAVVSQLKFTVQFWTASSRLAGIMGVPYLIFESPDQIWGLGQEGMRLNLCTRGNRKLIVSHFKNIYSDNTGGLDLVKQAVMEVERENYNDIIGMVENKDLTTMIKIGNLERIGGV